VDALCESSQSSGFEVTTHGGRQSAGRDALSWAKEVSDRGAGEVLLNSMDADGTRDGFDLEMITAFRQELSLPLIASGGAGKMEDFPRAVEAGADAVLAASVFHFGTVSIDAAKRSIAAAGQIVRLPSQD